MKNRRITNTIKITFTIFISIFTISSSSISCFADTVSYPDYSGTPFVEINHNQPDFNSSEKKLKKSFEEYGELDDLGRCSYAIALIGKDLMPTEDRESIGNVKPTGWHTVKYDLVDGKYLYNRCHLIGYQLTAENANKNNLITGTRYLNIEGMLPFENMVADYIKETNNHVLYRVIPVFEDNDLIAKGVTIEGYSIEDKGEGICFNVFCYNVQPGITIDYLTGDSAEGENTIIISSNNETSDQIEATQNSNIELICRLIIIFFIIIFNGYIVHSKGRKK